MAWRQLPQNYLEQQFDSLDLEHNFETGITDTERNVEKLSDYPDHDDDGRCPGSLAALTSEDIFLRRTPQNVVVHCSVCSAIVYATFRKLTNVWAKPTHDRLDAKRVE